MTKQDSSSDISPQAGRAETAAPDTYSTCLSAKQRVQKKKLIRYVIIFCCLLLPVLAWLQHTLLQGTIQLPITNTVLIFALININGLLLLLMLYLVLRNLVELIFERRQKILGAKLRTRLVVSFVSLSLIPTILLFFIALRFLSTSMEYWFNANVDESLEASLKLAQSVFQDAEQQATTQGIKVAELVSNNTQKQGNEMMNTRLAGIMSSLPMHFLDGLSLYTSNNTLLYTYRSQRMSTVPYSPPPSEALRQVCATLEPETITQKTVMGELIQVILPLFTPQQPQDAEPGYCLISSVLIPATKLQHMQGISEGIAGYRQLIMLKAPIKMSLIIMMLIITLLILFGAIWFGFYIARSLTGPINDLALATRRVADGDLDFLLEKESDDEMGLLVDSFNSMTSDLLASNKQLAQTHKALQVSTLVSEQQRQYLETILENVAAGVIAFDEQDNITTINRFAEDLLNLRLSDFIGNDFKEVLPRQHVLILQSFVRELLNTGKPSIERHLRITLHQGQTLSLQANITRMADNQGRPIGFVIVFDNLTKLEKAQRIAAWQEVARRIAHEIKNPLTPIQLSAQRLRKRYLASIEKDKDIFDQCTNTIVQQVDEIKKLVSEFSDFARMPRLNKTMNDLAKIIRETLFLYQEGHKHIKFSFTTDETIPSFSFDQVQLKRVLINLLENAIAVLPDGGEIDISLQINTEKDTVILNVTDTGPGISEEVRLRLFEPYFSTRKSGTGLGLAIAHTIVAEHNGKIKVYDNHPTGTCFAVEIPVQ